MTLALQLGRQTGLVKQAIGARAMYVARQLLRQGQHAGTPLKTLARQVSRELPAAVQLPTRQSVAPARIELLQSLLRTRTRALDQLPLQPRLLEALRARVPVLAEDPRLRYAMRLEDLAQRFGVTPDQLRDKVRLLGATAATNASSALGVSNPLELQTIPWRRIRVGARDYLLDRHGLVPPGSPRHTGLHRNTPRRRFQPQLSPADPQTLYKGQVTGQHGLPTEYAEAGQPIWFSGHPEVSMGYTHNLPQAQLLELPAAAVQRWGSLGPFTRHIAVDARQPTWNSWWRNFRSRFSPPAGQNRAWARSPYYERVGTMPATPQELLAPAKIWKPLPQSPGEWYLAKKPF